MITDLGNNTVYHVTCMAEKNAVSIYPQKFNSWFILNES